MQNIHDVAANAPRDSPFEFVEITSPPPDRAYSGPRNVETREMSLKNWLTLPTNITPAALTINHYLGKRDVNP
jgi:hypothetical protein